MFVSLLVDIEPDEGTQVCQLSRMNMEFKIWRISTGFTVTLSVDTLIVNSFFVRKYKKITGPSE